MYMHMYMWLPPSLMVLVRLRAALDIVHASWHASLAVPAATSVLDAAAASPGVRSYYTDEYWMWIVHIIVRYICVDVYAM